LYTLVGYLEKQQGFSTAVYEHVDAARTATSREFQTVDRTSYQEGLTALK